MAVNMELAQARGLTNTQIMMIDTMHDHLEAVISNTTLDHDHAELSAYVHSVEFKLQELWGFSQDIRFHTWAVRLRKHIRELEYFGVVYRCKETGETRTIDSQALHGMRLVQVGNGFIDFGGVVRIVGKLERVK